MASQNYWVPGYFHSYYIIILYYLHSLYWTDTNPPLCLLHLLENINLIICIS